MMYLMIGLLGLSGIAFMLFQQNRNLHKKLEGAFKEIAHREAVIAEQLIVIEKAEVALAELSKINKEKEEKHEKINEADDHSIASELNGLFDNKG